MREDSAVALGKVMAAYGDEAVEKVVTKLKEDLPKAKEQPKDSTKYGHDRGSGSWRVALLTLRAVLARSQVR